MKRLVLGFFLLLSVATVQANTCHRYAEPEVLFLDYTVDSLVVRPLAIGFAVAGTGLFVATLPFTLFRDSGKAFDAYVAEPFHAAFARCLGCDLGQSHRTGGNGC